MAKKIKIGLQKAKNEKLNIIKSKNDISDAVLNNLPIITFTGNRQIQIDGCLGIIEYEDYVIKTSIKQGYITFNGKNLKIEAFENYQIVFCGEIFTVEFSF